MTEPSEPTPPERTKKRGTGTAEEKDAAAPRTDANGDTSGLPPPNYWIRTVAFVNGHLVGAALGGLMIIGFVGWGLLRYTELQPEAPPGNFAGMANAAHQYCADLARTSERLAEQHNIVGWTITILVVVAAAVVVALANVAKWRILWVGVLGAAGLAGNALLQRSQAAGELADAAVAARVLERSDQGHDPSTSAHPVFAACARAWATWAKSRSESAGIARAALEEQLNSLKQTSSTEQAKARAASQANHTATAAVSEANTKVRRSTERLAQLVAGTPNLNREQINSINSIGRDITTAVQDAESKVVAATGEATRYVAVIGRAQTQKEGCDALGTAPPEAQLYLDPGHNTWNVVLGPFTRTEATESCNKAAASKCTVMPNPVDWELVTCSAAAP